MFSLAILLTVLVSLPDGRRALFTDNNACTTFTDYFISDISPNCFYNPDVDQNVPEILENHVGKYENHTVITDDGYILLIFRIPKENPKGVIFLAHPLSVDSFVWVGQGNTSVAFWFWQLGYDVWMLNQRGTSFSEKHVNLTVDDYEYWNFSFEEVGTQDYSTTIKHIANVTKNNEIILIGHSQSSTSAVIYASLKPEEAKKHLKIIIPMSNVASLTYMRSPVKYVAPLKNLLWSLSRLFKIGSLIRYNSFSGRVYRFLLKLPFKYAVIVIVSIFAGWNPGEFDPTWYTALSSMIPRGCSVKLLAHYGQYVSGQFNYFDYGEDGNQLTYNSSVPPEYPVWNISVPVYLVPSKDDSIATVDDSLELYSKFSEAAKKYGILVIENINHVDTHYGKDRYKYAYEPIMELLNKI